MLQLRPFLSTFRIALAAALAISACNEVGCNGPAASSGDRVLAKVSGTPITSRELTESMERSFGKPAADTFDAVGRRKVLESLVISRAMARAIEKELSPAELSALERRVAAYREELLVMHYLEKYAPPDAISDVDIEKYYKEHPERFGAKSVRRYEILASETQANQAARELLTKAFTDAPARSDWSAWSASLRGGGLPVQHSAARGNEDALHPRLRELVSSLAVGQTSALAWIEGRAFVVRLISVDELPPRPIREVSGQIRETLKPLALKRSIEKVRGKVLKSTDVEYMD